MTYLHTKGEKFPEKIMLNTELRKNERKAGTTIVRRSENFASPITGENTKLYPAIPGRVQVEFAL